MKRPPYVPVAALVLFALVVLPSSVVGQETSYDPARTPWGDPDLQGIWNNISGDVLTSTLINR